MDPRLYSTIAYWMLFFSRAFSVTPNCFIYYRSMSNLLIALEIPGSTPLVWTTTFTIHALCTELVNVCNCLFFHFIRTLARIFPSTVSPHLQIALYPLRGWQCLVWETSGQCLLWRKGWRWCLCFPCGVSASVHVLLLGRALSRRYHGAIDILTKGHFARWQKCYRVTLHLCTWHVSVRFIVRINSLLVGLLIKRGHTS